MNTTSLKRSFFGRIIVNKNTKLEFVINSLKNEIKEIQNKYTNKGDTTINNLEIAKQYYNEILEKIRDYTTLNPCPSESKSKSIDKECQKKKADYYRKFKEEITPGLINNIYGEDGKDVLHQEVRKQINNILDNASIASKFKQTMLIISNYTRQTSGKGEYRGIINMKITNHDTKAKSHSGGKKPVKKTTTKKSTTTKKPVKKPVKKTTTKKSTTTKKPVKKPVKKTTTKKSTTTKKPVKKPVKKTTIKKTTTKK